MIKKIYPLFLFCFFLSTAAIKAQSQDHSFYQKKEDTLSQHFESLAQAQSDKQKKAINQKIIRIFETILADEASFDYPFDKLQNVGKILSEDNAVRIFTWNLPYQDGTYEYFGYIQYWKSKKEMILLPLIDKSASISQPQSSTLNNKNWFGALYYNIIHTDYKGKDYYTLLGWDGNDLFTKKKVIDIITFKDYDQAQFGVPVFKHPNGITKRVVFEFNIRAKMVLRWDKKNEMIICDHLSPSKPQFEGQYQYYGPDFSYDAFYFEDGFWVYQADIDVKNPRSSLPKNRKVNKYK